MSTLERYNLVDDAWNAVVAGAISTSDFIDFARTFTAERDLAVWQSMAIAIRGLSRLIPMSAVDAFEKFVTTLVSPALAELGWLPAANESDLTSKLRGLLVQLVAIQGNHSSAARKCREILFDGTSADPELVAAATNVVAALGDDQDYEWFMERFLKPTTPQDQIRMLYALAEFDSESLIRRTAEFAFDGEVKTQNAPFLLNRCIANKHHGHVAWEIVRKNWDKANTEFPGNSIVRMVSSVTTLNTPELEQDVHAFFGEHPIPQATKTLEQVLERQRVNVALRSRESQTAASALGA